MKDRRSSSANTLIAVCHFALAITVSNPARAQDTIRTPWIPYVTYIHEFPNASIEFSFGEYIIHYDADTLGFYYPDIFDDENLNSPEYPLNDDKRTYECSDVTEATKLSKHSWWGSSIVVGAGDTLTYFHDKYSFPHRGSVYAGLDIADTILYVFEIINTVSGDILTIDTVGTTPYYYDDMVTYTDLPDLRRRKSIEPNDTAVVKRHVFTSEQLPDRTQIVMRWRLLCAEHTQYVLYRRAQNAFGSLSESKIEYRATMIDQFRKQIERLKGALTKPRKL